MPLIWHTVAGTISELVRCLPVEAWHLVVSVPLWRLGSLLWHVNRALVVLVLLLLLLLQKYLLLVLIFDLI